MEFNVADLFVIIVFALSILSGCQKGLVRSIFAVISVIIALFFAINLAVPVGLFFRGNEASVLFNVIAGAVIYAIVFAILKAAGELLHSIASLPVLDIINKLGGALIGLVQGAITVWIAVTIVKLLPINEFLLNCHYLIQTSRIAVWFM